MTDGRSMLDDRGDKILISREIPGGFDALKYVATGE